MEHFHVAFRLYECRHLRGLEDVVSLAQRLPGQGFLPAEPPNAPEPSQDIEALVSRQWKPNPTFRPEKPFDGFPQYGVFFRILLKQGPEVLGGFSCKFFSLDHSTVEIGGLIDTAPQPRSSDLELYAQNLLELALSLYPHLNPSFGWVDENEATGRWIEEAVAVKLKIISWANFFGPRFVAKYGRDFLLGLPGWKTEELADGGVFHQLTPSIIASDSATAQQLRREVIAYCRKAGLRVQCRAPYVIAKGSRAPVPETDKRSGKGSRPTQRSEVEGYGSDEEFRDYLDQILATTLVLKDRTRVKPIYILWAWLTPRQREMALAQIKTAAIHEIRAHRNVPIRFEFNELPEDLERMMRDLVGENNPDFVYVQVDMG